MKPTPYDTIAAAIRFLDVQHAEQPRLAEVAEAVGLSESHLQRQFSAWAGISPKRFLQILTRNDARRLLQQTRRTFPSALDAGLSGGGRLHDLFVHCEGVTPGEVARLGKDLELHYGFAATPFGMALLAHSPRGICHLRFLTDDDASGDGAIADFVDAWPLACRTRDDRQAQTLSDCVFGKGRPPAAPLSLWVKGTNFQVQVWQALLHIPAGEVSTYGDLATHLGRPSGARAVGNAVGANPVAWLIPCHRVIRETGAFGGYRWGVPRKRAMLAVEAAQTGATDAQG